MLTQDKQQLIEVLQQAAQAATGMDALPQVLLERPKMAEHGDFACNIAMQVAKAAKKNPRELAQAIVAHLQADPVASTMLSGIEIAGPGFINLRVAPAAKQRVVQTILTQTTNFGRGNAGHDAQGDARRIMVEFVSANPTGPLHVGHARQAALGDVLCNIFAFQGWNVHREFYYNDAGNQIANLGISVQARAKGIGPQDPSFPADGYRGDYINDIAQDFLARKTVSAADGEPVSASGDVEDLENIRRFAVTYLRNEQDLDLQAFNLKFDCYYLESSVYSDGGVERTVQALVDSGNTYEEGGALWLRTTQMGEGDDKDRVMRKSDGSFTYFVPDVAYHVTKWKRGFVKVINIQGTDHFGTIARVRSGLQALNLGIPKGYPDYVLNTMVKVMRGGEEVKISKRTGGYVTMRDLIDWVGRDAVRFFLISRKADTEFTFDVDVALSQSDENPVYYVQYAHARIGKILRDWGGKVSSLAAVDMSALNTEAAQKLMQYLAQFVDTAAQAAQEQAPHQVAFYLKDCAAQFHSYYNAERVLVDDEATKLARLALIAATAQVIRNGLALLGVSAPDKM